LLPRLPCILGQKQDITVIEPNFPVKTLMTFKRLAEKVLRHQKTRCKKVCRYLLIVFLLQTTPITSNNRELPINMSLSTWFSRKCASSCATVSVFGPVLGSIDSDPLEITAADKRSGNVQLPFRLYDPEALLPAQ